MSICLYPKVVDRDSYFHMVEHVNKLIADTSLPYVGLQKLMLKIK